MLLNKPLDLVEGINWACIGAMFRLLLEAELSYRFATMGGNYSVNDIFKKDSYNTLTISNTSRMESIDEHQGSQSPESSNRRDPRALHSARSSDSSVASTNSAIVGERRLKQSKVEDMYRRGIIDKAGFDSESKFLQDKFAGKTKKSAIKKDTNILLGNTSKDSRNTYSELVKQENTSSPLANLNNNNNRSPSEYSDTQQGNQSSTSIATSGSSNSNKGSIPVLLDLSLRHSTPNVEPGQYDPENRL